MRKIILAFILSMITACILSEMNGVSDFLAGAWTMCVYFGVIRYCESKEIEGIKNNYSQFNQQVPNS